MPPNTHPNAPPSALFMSHNFEHIPVSDNAFFVDWLLYESFAIQTLLWKPISFALNELLQTLRQLPAQALYIVLGINVSESIF